MQYVLTKNGATISGPFPWATIRDLCGLAGNKNAPMCPWVLADGRELEEYVPPAPVGPTLAQAKSSKTEQIKAAAESFLAPYRAEYGPTEVATWDQQYAEAVEGEGPLLAAIGIARGMSVSELATRILANRAAWVSLTGTVVGKRLAYQDEVDAAETVEEIQAITPIFN